MGKERTFRHFLAVGSLIAEAALVPSKCTFLLAGILSLEQENILSPNLKHHDHKYFLFLFTVFDSFFFIFFKLWHLRFTIEVWDKEGGRNHFPISIRCRKKKKKTLVQASSQLNLHTEHMKDWDRKGPSIGKFFKNFFKKRYLCCFLPLNHQRNLSPST